MLPSVLGRIAIVRTNRCFRMRRGYLRSGGSGPAVSSLGASAVSSSDGSAASLLVVAAGRVAGVSFVWRVVSAVLSNRTLFLVFLGGLLVAVRAAPSVVPLVSSGLVAGAPLAVVGGVVGSMNGLSRSTWTTSVFLPLVGRTS